MQAEHERDEAPACSGKPFWHMNARGSTLGCAGNSSTSCDEPLQTVPRAPGEMVVEGGKTNKPLHQELIRQDDADNGDYSTKWIEERLAKREEAASTKQRRAARSEEHTSELQSLMRQSY